MEKMLNEILNTCASYAKNGEVASYIPELSKASPDEFGICVISSDGNVSAAGDYEKRFTIQSIVKPLILLRALQDRGEETVRALVGEEATGKPFDAFNYSDQALTGEHINPMVNAGAIAMCTLISGENYREKFDRLLSLVKKISKNPNVEIDEAVYLSEKSTGNKNRALAYMLKAYGMIDDDIEEVLDCYFKACSVKMSCVDLANIALMLANRGVDVSSGERVVDASHARYVNAVLMTCGMYDGSGAFAVNVGLPAKSGVGGGIMAVVPHKMGIGLYSPALDKKGNSIAGIKALELLSRKLELSIF